MARCQAERGLEVHVATTDDNGQERLASNGSTPIWEGGAAYWIFPRQTRFYQASVPLTLWLRAHVRDYDLVHIHALFSYASVASALYARSAGVPYLVRPLGTLGKWGMRHRRRLMKSVSFHLIESRIVRHAARVHFTSEQEASEALELGVSHKAVVIANPVDLPPTGTADLSCPRIRRERLIILFLSRLDPKKGLDLLLPAFAGLRRNHPDAMLVIAGDGDPVFVAGLKKQAGHLDEDSGIRWTGFLRGEEKNAVLADADLFVLPSYSENFGVAVVEAMSSGLPVIVSDQVGIHKEIVAAQAGLVVQCASEQLEQALVRLSTDHELRERMGRNARVLACQYTPESVTEKMIDVYREIRNQSNESVGA
jgi:glycosyltransferase involved in cell wall biosynthesis